MNYILLIKAGMIIGKNAKLETLNTAIIVTRHR